VTRALPVHPALPAVVLAVAQRLEADRHATYVGGECLADLLCGRPRRHFSLSTTAGAGDIAKLFDRAVQTRAAGLAYQLPTAAGPIDLLPLGPGRTIDDTLALRGLTLLAMAWRPVGNEWLDPYAGRADLEQGRLRTVGAPERELERAPLLALQIARFVGLHGDVPAPELEAALGSLDATVLDRSPAVMRGRLLRALVSLPRAGDAIALLARTGLDAALGVRSKPDTPALLERAPDDPAIRFAIWLRGSRPGRFFRRHRIARELADQVIELLAAHPLERNFSPGRRASLERLERIPEARRDALFWLREQELRGAPVDAEFSATRRAFEALVRGFALHLEVEAARIQAPPLALDGQSVMDTLGIDPGPRVGEALAFLRARVAAFPETNQAATLRAALREWAQSGARDQSDHQDDPVD
jgi:tRNA nucleotidyltransferase (CCA-adding enzyme)